jgi:hypothetical protein
MSPVSQATRLPSTLEAVAHPCTSLTGWAEAADRKAGKEIEYPIGKIIISWGSDCYTSTIEGVCLYSRGQQCELKGRGSTEQASIDALFEKIMKLGLPGLHFEDYLCQKINGEVKYFRIDPTSNERVVYSMTDQGSLILAI